MDHRSVTAEDYLKIIDELTLYKGFATLNDISKFLSVTRQSVYDEMNILIEQKLVERTNKGEYVLTPSGKKEANIFLRKHRIAEILLSRSINMPWNLLDSEAMGIEHGITENIAKLVCDTYGCKTCPHGNPVPDEDGNVTDPDDLFFRDLRPLSRFKISRVIFESSEVLNFLHKHDLLPGSTIEVGEDGEVLVSGSGGRASVPESISTAVKYIEF
ncbi:MAG: metal-dependent transcriptional regulator [Thermoplasmataceae archaeon]